MSSSDPRDALRDMMNSLSGVFKKYDRSARKTAWNSLVSSDGKNEINKLLNSPNRPIVGVPKLVRRSFKDWFNADDSTI